MADLWARLGTTKPSEPTIWIHGASVGEMNAARPVIKALAVDHPVLVTATTTTGRTTVAGWGYAGVTAQLAPIDWLWVTRRILRRSRIKALIIIENELWPLRIAAAHRAFVPVMMINARMSESSARTWRKFPGLAKTVLAPMQLIAPQDSASGGRLRELGAKNVNVSVNLKSHYAPKQTTIPQDVAGFRSETTLLAAATHAGEEEIVLDAFRRLRDAHADWQLIIAPRHPDRAPEIMQLCAKAGLPATLRSRNEPPNKPVYIADTFGEMHLWYRLAGVAFIGGSLVAKGGHTPFEPCAYGCPILHGPHVANFAEAFAKLKAIEGASQVSDAPTLAAAFEAHIGDHAMATRAKTALGQSDLTPLLNAIKTVLDPSTSPAGKL